MSEERQPVSVPTQRLLSAADRQPAQRRALLLEVVTRVIHPSVMVVGVYLLLAGLHRTGGGFSAGLVIGLGLVLRRLAGGPHELGAAAPAPPGVLLGGGLTLAAGYGAAGVVFSDTLLKSYTWVLHLGPLGDLDITGSLIFEVGIVAIVVGLVLDVLRTLGAEEERER
ncbi:MAG TPA: MnhB domain-containing protein [Nocardioidaceae bacterium]|nr:MnhB domain-containing protein [Nocardioidaceae bacterium]